MSAWVVSSAHIDVLTAALVQHDFIAEELRASVGQMLWQENHDSVNARYGENEGCPRYTPAPVPAGKFIGDIHVIAAAGCYQYQSCEHDAWEASRARTLTMALLGAVSSIETLTKHQEEPNAWKWGYDSLDDALEDIP